MFEKLKKLYQSGKLTRVGLDRALKKEWITEEQYQEIINSISS